MKKLFYLSTCDTCKRIIKEASLDTAGIEFQDIKKNPISNSDLESLRPFVDSYEALFNKRARKYASEGLKGKEFTDEEWKSLILGEYTFLKRPVVLLGKEAFIGNSKKTVTALKTILGHAE